MSHETKGQENHFWKVPKKGEHGKHHSHVLPMSYGGRSGLFCLLRSCPGLSSWVVGKTQPCWALTLMALLLLHRTVNPVPGVVGSASRKRLSSFKSSLLNSPVF